MNKVCIVFLSIFASCAALAATPTHGDKIDELHGVDIFYNGGFDKVSGRNLSKDGYNFGLKYQCVEFVKRYYFERFNHRMKNTWGHAKDFYNSEVSDGSLNKERGLLQFSNGSKSKPMVGDIIVFGGSQYNPYGHIAIVSKVSNRTIETAQQNTDSRIIISLSKKNGRWFAGDSSTRGWLRKGD